MKQILLKKYINKKTNFPFASLFASKTDNSAYMWKKFPLRWSYIYCFAQRVIKHRFIDIWKNIQDIGLFLFFIIDTKRIVRHVLKIN